MNYIGLNLKIDPAQDPSRPPQSNTQSLPCFRPIPDHSRCPRAGAGEGGQHAAAAGGHERPGQHGGAGDVHLRHRQQAAGLQQRQRQWQQVTLPRMRHSAMLFHALRSPFSRWRWGQGTSLRFSPAARMRAPPSRFAGWTRCSMAMPFLCAVSRRGAGAPDAAAAVLAVQARPRSSPLRERRLCPRRSRALQRVQAAMAMGAARVLED